MKQPPNPLSVAISGASGLVGRGLIPRLEAAGHQVLRLERRGEPGADPARVLWSPETGVREPEKLEGVDAIVHLAGESIAGGRWTRRKRQEIRRSRIVGTRKLVASLATLERPPASFMCASAVGYYGNTDERADTPVDERSPAGRGFLAEVCVDWEKEAECARDFGARVVRLRFGVILSSTGGALAKMLPALRSGLGGRLGGGRQIMAWISLRDCVNAIETLLSRDDLSGAFNLTAPRPASNRCFTARLGGALGRPTPLAVPAALLSATFGGMARETLLASNDVRPTRLLEAGFEFEHSELDNALSELLAQTD